MSTATWQRRPSDGGPTGSRAHSSAASARRSSAFQARISTQTQDRGLDSVPISAGVGRPAMPQCSAEERRRTRRWRVRDCPRGSLQRSSQSNTSPVRGPSIPHRASMLGDINLSSPLGRNVRIPPLVTAVSKRRMYACHRAVVCAPAVGSTGVSPRSTAASRRGATDCASLPEGGSLATLYLCPQM
jgi:hypothetical protein